MALVEYYIGTQGPFLADDTKDADILAHGGQVVRQEQLPGISAATTVVGETAFGQASAVGTSVKFARQDHTHGTPADPLAGGLTTTVTVVVGPLLTNTKVLTFTNGKLTGVV